MILSPSAVVTATGSSSTTRVPSNATAAVFMLDVTAAATAAGDTLNVRIQHTVDGTAFDDIVSFTQVLGNGGAKQFVGYWAGSIATGTAVRALATRALAAGSVINGAIGGLIRVDWVVVSASAPSFTFAAHGTFLGER